LKTCVYEKEHGIGFNQLEIYTVETKEAGGGDNG